MGNNSALLTLYYLALGYLNPLIYYGEHSVMISSTLDMSAWDGGCVRGAEPPPSLTTRQTHTWNECTHILHAQTFRGCAYVGTFTHTSVLIDTNIYTGRIQILRCTGVDTCPYGNTEKGRNTHTDYWLAMPDVPPTCEDKASSFVPNNHRKLVCVVSNLPMENVFQQIGTLSLSVTIVVCSIKSLSPLSLFI